MERGPLARSNSPKQRQITFVKKAAAKAYPGGITESSKRFRELRATTPVCRTIKTLSEGVPEYGEYLKRPINTRRSSLFTWHHSSPSFNHAFTKPKSSRHSMIAHTAQKLQVRSCECWDMGDRDQIISARNVTGAPNFFILTMTFYSAPAVAAFLNTRLNTRSHHVGLRTNISAATSRKRLFNCRFA